MRRACVTWLLFVAACEPSPGSPFAVTATAEIQAAVGKFCADRIDGYHDGAGSLWGNGPCYVLMNYDSDNLRIDYLIFETGLSFDQFRTFARELVLPMVKPEIRAFLEQQVLADLGVDKQVVYSVRGKGEVRYQNQTFVSDDKQRLPHLSLSITWK